MKSIFTNIYENCVWGDNEDDRYSGSSGTGSSVYYNREYIEFLRKFIIDNEVKSVVDY